MSKCPLTSTPNLTRKRQMVLTCVGRTLVLASNERAALRRESNGEHFKSPVQTRCKSGNLHFPQIHWEIRCHSTPCSAQLWSLTPGAWWHALVELKWLSRDTGQKESILSQGLETSQTKNISSVRTEKFYSKHQEESKVKLKWKGLAPKLWLLLLPEFWMNRLYFNLSRSHTANKQQEMHKPTHFDTVPLHIRELHVLLSTKSWRESAWDFLQ